MQLSQNLKIFSKFFAAFPQSTSNLEYFLKKDKPPRGFLSEIIDSKNRDYLNP